MNKTILNFINENCEITNNKLKVYLNVVSTLQINDRNACYDEILEDNSYNLEYSYNELRGCLERIINEDGLEGEELEFYQGQLNKLNN